MAFCIVLNTTVAHSALSPTTDKILLQNDCNGIANCSTNMTEVIQWVNQDRIDKNKHVIIDIGPGIFTVQPDAIFCQNSNNISYRGTGRDSTIITGSDALTLATGPFVIGLSSCENISVQNLTIRTDSRNSNFTTGSISGVGAIGESTSKWSNVDIQASVTGWYNVGGVHNWYGSNIDVDTVNATVFSTIWGIYVQGGASWFFGGEITLRHKTQNDLYSIIGMGVNGGQGQIYGSLLRVILEENAGTILPISAYGAGALIAYNGGSAHMHGGNISVNSAITQDIFGVSNSSDVLGSGTVHTPDTAFTINSAGDAQRIRLTKHASPMSPFLWPSNDTLPNITSLNGADIFVETDCQNIGNCDVVEDCASDINCSIPDLTSTHPHLMIYDNSCLLFGSSWFDSTTGKCRGEQ